MKFRNLLVLNAVSGLAFGIGFVLVPTTVMDLYGMTPSPSAILAGRYFGVELIAVGLLCLFAVNVSDAAAQRAIILAFLIAR